MLEEVNKDLVLFVCLLFACLFVVVVVLVLDAFTDGCGIFMISFCPITLLLNSSSWWTKEAYRTH